MIIERLLRDIEAYTDMGDVLTMNEKVSMSDIPSDDRRKLYIALTDKAKELQCDDAMAVFSNIKQGDL